MEIKDLESKIHELKARLASASAPSGSVRIPSLRQSFYFLQDMLYFFFILFWFTDGAILEDLVYDQPRPGPDDDDREADDGGKEAARQRDRR